MSSHNTPRSEAGATLRGTTCGTPVGANTPPSSARRSARFSSRPGGGGGKAAVATPRTPRAPPAEPLHVTIRLRPLSVAGNGAAATLQSFSLGNSSGSAALGAVPPTPTSATTTSGAAFGVGDPTPVRFSIEPSTPASTPLASSGTLSGSGTVSGSGLSGGQTLVVKAQLGAGVDGQPVEESRTYEFGTVLGPDSDENAVAAAVVPRVLEQVRTGYNATVMCYGQTGSGKTYTVSQLLPCIVDAIFASCGVDGDDSKAGGGCRHIVELSYLQIYNNNAYNLLSDGGGGSTNGSGKSEFGEPLPKPKGYLVTEPCVVVKSAAEVFQKVEDAQKRRATATHAMNHRSSRSHTLLGLRVSKCLEGTPIQVSKITIADLAGSERLKKTGAAGETKEEAIAINSSLSTLARCVEGIAEGADVVPFRENILTLYLAQSLTDACMLLIATCSLETFNYNETKNTLDFATIAKKCVVKRVANTERLTRNVTIEASMRQLVLEIQMLRQRVEELQEEADLERGRAAMLRENLAVSIIRGTGPIAVGPPAPSSGTSPATPASTSVGAATNGTFGASVSFATAPLGASASTNLTQQQQTQASQSSAALPLSSNPPVLVAAGTTSVVVSTMDISAVQERIVSLEGQAHTFGHLLRAREDELRQVEAGRAMSNDLEAELSQLLEDRAEAHRTLEALVSEKSVLLDDRGQLQVKLRQAQEVLLWQEAQTNQATERASVLEASVGQLQGILRKATADLHVARRSQLDWEGEASTARSECARLQKQNAALQRDLDAAELKWLKERNDKIAQQRAAELFSRSAPLGAASGVALGGGNSPASSSSSSLVLPALGATATTGAMAEALSAAVAPANNNGSSPVAGKDVRPAPQPLAQQSAVQRQSFAQAQTQAHAEARLAAALAEQSALVDTLQRRVADYDRELFEEQSGRCAAEERAAAAEKRAQELWSRLPAGERRRFYTGQSAPPNAGGVSWGDANNGNNSNNVNAAAGAAGSGANASVEAPGTSPRGLSTSAQSTVTTAAGRNGGLSYNGSTPTYDMMQLRARLRHLSALHEEAVAQLALRDCQVRDADAEICGLQDALRDKEEQYESLAQLETAHSLRGDRLEQVVDDLYEELHKRGTERAALERQLQELQVQHDGLDAEHKAALAETDRLHAELQETSERLRSKESCNDELSARLRAVETDRNAASQLRATILSLEQQLKEQVTRSAAVGQRRDDVAQQKGRLWRRICSEAKHAEFVKARLPAFATGTGDHSSNNHRQPREGHGATGNQRTSGASSVSTVGVRRERSGSASGHLDPGASMSAVSASAATHSEPEPGTRVVDAFARQVRNNKLRFEVSQQFARAKQRAPGVGGFIPLAPPSSAPAAGPPGPAPPAAAAAAGGSSESLPVTPRGEHVAPGSGLGSSGSLNAMRSFRNARSPAAPMDRVSAVQRRAQQQSDQNAQHTLLKTRQVPQVPMLPFGRLRQVPAGAE